LGGEEVAEPVGDLAEFLLLAGGGDEGAGFGGDFEGLLGDLRSGGLEGFEEIGLSRCWVGEADQGDGGWSG